MLHRPSILLLDEPTVGVDPQSRERIYEMLQDLTAEGMNLAGVKRVLQLEHELQVLREALERAQSQAAEDVDSVHRHYRRDLVPVKQAVVLYQKDRRR